MSYVLNPKPNKSIYDPCCGSGGLLIKCHLRFRQKYDEDPTISELIDGTRQRDLVLPEFQREFVWTKEQAKQLMVSLIKDYPVGSLLFWKTGNLPELKNIDKLQPRFRRVSIVSGYKDEVEFRSWVSLMSWYVMELVS